MTSQLLVAEYTSVMNDVQEIYSPMYSRKGLLYEAKGWIVIKLSRSHGMYVCLDKPLTINAKLNSYETMQELMSNKAAALPLICSWWNNIWIKIWLYRLHILIINPIASTSAQLQCYLVCESLPLIQVDYRFHSRHSMPWFEGLDYLLRIKGENNKQCHHSSLQAIHHGVDALSVPTDIQSCI